MSETKLTKKQQKAAQFKAAKKGKSAVLEDHPATPDDIPDPEDAPSAVVPEASSSTSKKAAKKAKSTDKTTKESGPVEQPTEVPPAVAPVKEEKRKHKRKRLEAEAEAGIVSADATSTKQDTAATSEAPKKRKSKAKTEPAANAKKTTFGDDGEVAAEEAVAPAPTTSTEPTSAKGSKFILFVGNMAFTTTADYISKHFGQACGEVPSVRLLTRKADPNALANLPASKRKSIAKGKALDPTKPQSKGCAFVEFKTSEALRKALKFHHTLLEGRKINVELTAGGGGKSETRVEKIKAKNAGLEKERAKLHGKYVVPKNEERKRRGGDRGETGEGEGREAKRQRREEGEQGQSGGWTRNSGRERKLPKFMATGANAVRVAPTS